MSLPRVPPLRTLGLLSLVSLTLACPGCPVAGDVVRAYVPSGAPLVLAVGSEGRYRMAGQVADYWAAPPTALTGDLVVKENTAPEVVEVLEAQGDGVLVRARSEGEATLQLRARFGPGEDFPVALTLGVAVPRRVELTLGPACRDDRGSPRPVLAGTSFDVRLALTREDGQVLAVGGLVPDVEVLPAGALDVLDAAVPAPADGFDPMGDFERAGPPTGFPLRVRAGTMAGPAELRARLDGTSLALRVASVAELDALDLVAPEPGRRFPPGVADIRLTPRVSAGGGEVCGTPRSPELALRTDTPSVCTVGPGDDADPRPRLSTLAAGECRVTLALPQARGGVGLELQVHFTVQG